MTVTIAPSAEACLALVDRINSGTAYSLDRVAKYSRVEVSPLEEIRHLEIDVVAVDEEQLSETLDIEDRTSHKIAIWIRDKLPDLQPETIDELCLLVRQIFQRVNNFDSADGRVRVWEVDKGTRMTPDKDRLNTMHLFDAVVMLWVRVDTSP